MALVDEGSNQLPLYIHYDPGVNGGQLVATSTPSGNTDGGTGGGGGGNPGGPSVPPSGGAGGGGGGSSQETLAGFDWSDYLGMFGLPSDLVTEIDKIFSANYDVTTAAQLALSYIRGTDWYAQTYPGIKEGIAKGVVSNEADYRSYLNQANQLYQNFYGRSITSSELAALLNNGVDITLLGKQLNATANLASLQKLAVSNYFTQDELQQIANTNAGLPSSTGDYLNGLLQYTQSVAPLYSQYGVPLTRGVIENNFKNGVTSDVIGKQLQGNAYIQANSPDIQYLAGAFGGGALNSDQLTAYGQQQAGLDSGLGEQLNTMISKAQARLNRIFQGSLATPSLSLTSGGGLSAPSLGVPTKPDVAA